MLLPDMSPGLVWTHASHTSAHALPAHGPRGSNWAHNRVGALLQKNMWSGPPELHLRACRLAAQRPADKVILAGGSA